MLWQEMKKILKRRTVIIIFFGIFLLVICKEMYYGSYQVEHYEDMRKEIAFLDKYSGELTDERMEAMLEECHQIFPDASERAILSDYWEEADSVAELFPDITFPLTFGNAWWWVDALDELQSNIKYIPIFIVAAFAPLFSWERDCGMLPILLGCKNGREKCTRAKVLVAFLITNLLFLIVSVLSFARLFLLSGVTGYDTSVQIWKTILGNCPVPMTFGCLALHSLLISFLSLNFILLLVLCAAFRAKNPLTVMGVAIGLLYVIRIDTVSVIFNSLTADRIVSLLPLNVIDAINSADNLSSITIGSLQVPWMYILEIIYVVLVAAAGAFFFRVVAKEQLIY